jgi:hypothetical protein
MILNVSFSAAVTLSTPNCFDAVGTYKGKNQTNISAAVGTRVASACAGRDSPDNKRNPPARPYEQTSTFLGSEWACVR